MFIKPFPEFSEIRTSTWAFLEAYGWITVFIIVLTYIIYKKYIYNVMKAKAEEKKLIEQRKFGKVSLLFVYLMRNFQIVKFKRERKTD